MNLVNAGNNFMSRLTNGLSDSDTSLSLDNISGLPSPPFLLTLNNGKENMEIVKVIDVDVEINIFFIQRGQEGTTAQSHEAGSIVENNFTAGTYQALVDEIKALKQQSGIVEMGENENGHYIRYENGLQECWHYIRVERQVALRIGFTWEFPRSFISKPVINFNLSTEDYDLSISLRDLAEGYVRETNNDSCEVSWIRASESPTAFGVDDYAYAYVKVIGYWK